ncbi:MAG: putative rane protein [Clostridia bacterium]|jgi:hypothetical protein|uniref:hypothetical protein n=1 Tax=Petroclostridium xylanilyticum TaxID=1792311 RepID=UPI000B98502A|nr:hypothetical protein [Petroclostridium xylanilyticum]MBZ4645159.1 putative rane protein [Clostridia bacterium]
MVESQNSNIGKKVALGGFATALAVICLYLASILPTNRLFFYAISSMFLLAMVIEFGVSSAVVTYISTALLAFIIIPDKLMLIPYVLFFGYYGIIKYYVEKINNLIIEWIIKLLLFNISMYILYIITVKMLFETITTRFPIWITVVLGEIAFVVYDYGYSMAAGYYKYRLRKLFKI